jgi:hypothetical protein
MSTRGLCFDASYNHCIGGRLRVVVVDVLLKEAEQYLASLAYGCVYYVCRSEGYYSQLQSNHYIINSRGAAHPPAFPEQASRLF